MSPVARVRVRAVVGLGLLVVPLLAAHRVQTSGPPVAASLIAPPRARSPFEQALRAAAHHRMQARFAVNQDREALEVWDPEAMAPPPDGGDPEAWRLQEMAADRSGHLGQARAEAWRAAALARTPNETCRAAALLVLIEHESGSHEEELRQAQVLVALKPKSYHWLMVLRRAAGCVEEKGLQQWATERAAASATR